MLLQVCKSFPSVVSRARRSDLVHVECLQMIKAMVVVSVPLEVDVILGDC